MWAPLSLLYNPYPGFHPCLSLCTTSLFSSSFSWVGRTLKCVCVMQDENAAAQELCRAETAARFPHSCNWSTTAATPIWQIEAGTFFFFFFFFSPRHSVEMYNLALAGCDANIFTSPNILFLKISREKEISLQVASSVLQSDRKSRNAGFLGASCPRRLWTQPQNSRFHPVS